MPTTKPKPHESGVSLAVQAGGEMHPPAAVHPLLLGLSSGLLLWCAFPPVEWNWLAWVSLVPLFLLIRSKRHPAWIYLAAWLGGEVFWLASIRWVRLADETAFLGWVVMASVLALWWPVFMLLARLAVGRLRLPLIVAAPFIWVGLEYGRAHLLTGFPWYYLAHTQAYNPFGPGSAYPLIQFADLTGAWGVSLLVAMVNVVWVDWIVLPRWRRTPNGARLERDLLVKTGAVAGMVALALIYGFWRIGAARFREGPAVALLQTDIVQRYRDSITPQQAMEKFKWLVRKALPPTPRQGAKEWLIVWPETSYPYGYVTIDPGLSEAELDRQAKLINQKWTAASTRERQKDVADDIHGWADEAGTPMLVGMIHYVFKPGGPARYNGAILIMPGSREIQAYHKLHLVPFGEYVPLVDLFPWLVALTPYRGNRVAGLTFGEDVSSFDLGPWRFVCWICFEDTVPHLSRRFFSGEAKGRQPDFVVNMSNDGWFHGSEEHDMHLAVGIFRAIENRVPIVRAVNLGISAIVDGNGVVRSRLPKKVMSVLQGTVPLDDRESLYSKAGDWLGIVAIASVGVILLVGPFVKKRKSIDPGQSQPHPA